MTDYLISLFVAVDQLLNAICGGEPDMTISARLGQFSGRSRYFRALARLVDWAFLPLEGPGHCQRAFEREAGRSDRLGNETAQAALGVVLVVVVPVIGMILRVAKMTGIIHADKH